MTKIKKIKDEQEIVSFFKDRDGYVLVDDVLKYINLTVFWKLCKSNKYIFIEKDKTYKIN